MQKKPLLGVLIGAWIALSGCSELRFPGLYRITIEQGNIITQEMVDQLRPGMNRRQVRFIMGTPMINDPFNESRWDYLYSLQEPRGKRVQKRISLFFENDLLVSFRGDFLPTDAATEPVAK